MEEDEDLTCSGNSHDADGNMQFGGGGKTNSKYVDGNGDFIAGLCSTKGTPDHLIDGRANAEMNATDICGPVHVLDFEAGRMILEYKETLIADEKPPCEGGMFLPFIPGEMMWGPEGHAFIYFLMLGFSFLGIAIIADVFMAAIEVITAKTKMVPDGKGGQREVKVWNDTIANLTLMALGSSAPEILLSVLETIGMVQAPADPGGLGPGTIVGSAAFNLLVIIAICVIAIGKKEDGSPDTRKIEEIGVFTTTAFYSVFAYVWLFICVSDNQIVMWEAVVTFLLFPVLTIHCYMADKKMLCYGMFGGKAKTAPPKTEEELAAAVHQTDALKIAMDASKATDEDLVKAYGDIPADLARERMMEDAASLALKQSGAQKPTIMTAKINARRGMTGGKRVLVQTDNHAKPHGGLGDAQAARPVETKEIVTSAAGAKISFSSPTYAAEEGKGKVTLHIVRTEDTAGTVHVQYATSDGTALSGEDFEHARGIVTFAPGDSVKDVVIKLIDDSSYEPDENFYVSLKEAKGGKKGPGASSAFSFGDYDFACVTILNDDKPGTFGFENSSLTVTEDSEFATFKVLRTSGCDGDISVSYKTIDGTAHAGADYDAAEGSLSFADGETEKVIKVRLIEDDQFEKNETFSIQLGVTAEGAQLKDDGLAEVTILGDEEAEAFAKEIAKIMKAKMNEMNGTVDTATYADQFNEAMNINGEEGEDPGTMDYVMHFLTFGWKVIFATVPPTSWQGGWVTFFVALAYIGVLTAFVADIASIFGCLLTLPDAITAITFVALGTSLPDTFASKSAATQDETADNSVGNVTGSNSVNVFLGLGLPWLIACGANSSYTAPPVKGWEYIDGEKTPITIDGKDIEFDKGAFPVLAGTMGSSVVLFCGCAVACIFTLYIRRWTGLGELGGPSGAKNLTAVFFVGLWMVYVVVSSLLEKGHIDPFM